MGVLSYFLMKIYVVDTHWKSQPHFFMEKVKNDTYSTKLLIIIVIKIALFLANL